MNSVVGNKDLRLMLTNKIIGKGKTDLEVPGSARAFARYNKGNRELARQTFQAAEKALLHEANAVAKVKTGNHMHFDADLLNTAKFWDAKLLGGCLELLQMELKGSRIEESLMVHADETMNVGNEMQREGNKADDHYVKKTVLAFGKALVARGQALHNLAFLGNRHGL